jgi:hypothetical protein
MESIISIHKSVHGEETLRGSCQVRTRIFEKQRMEAQNAEKTISNRRENQDLVGRRISGPIHRENEGSCKGV